MKFSKGERVKFLNEKGEGIITGIISAAKVKVLTSEGVEIIYDADQLVSAEHGQTRKGNEQETIPVKGRKILSGEKTDAGAVMGDGIYLLFSPLDGQRLLECDIDIDLVNNTDYDILYSYSYRYEQLFAALCTGSAEEGSVTALDTIMRSRIDEYSTIKTDIIFFKNMPYEPLEPVSEIIKLKTVKFYKPNIYIPNPFDGRLSYLVPVCLMETEEEEREEMDPDFRQKVDEFISRRKDKGKHISHPREYYMKQLEKEVDLHLDEILDDSSAMSNAEKLDYQLNYFRRELEAAIAGNIHKIVFIHGVGNGRLKAEIRALLDAHYQFRYYDASFRKYGFGATEVIIR